MFFATASQAAQAIWLEDDTKTFFSANHKLHGIFLAHGPGIKKNQKIENAKIYDLAPTILHLFGLPIPNDMDGRVLTELFEEDSELIKRKPNYGRRPAAIFSINQLVY